VGTGLDLTRELAAFSWRARIPLAEGLASTVALFRRQHVLQRLELQHIDNRL